MTNFESPTDLVYNREPISDPEAFARESLARAEADGAPFAGSEELREWVAEGLRELSRDAKEE